VVLAVLDALVRPQKHSAVMLSRTARSNKTVALHSLLSKLAGQLLAEADGCGCR
jgi:hypothetical protein